MCLNRGSTRHGIWGQGSSQLSYLARTSVYSLFQICLPVILRGLSQNSPISSYYSGSQKPQLLPCCCSLTKSQALTEGSSWQETALLSLHHAAHRSSGCFSSAWEGCVMEHSNAREVISQGWLNKWEVCLGPSRNSIESSQYISGDMTPEWESRWAYREAVASWLKHHIVFALSCLSFQFFNPFSPGSHTFIHYRVSWASGTAFLGIPR